MPIDTPSKSPPEVPQNKRGCGGLVRTDSSLLQLPLGHCLAGCESDGPEKRKSTPRSPSARCPEELRDLQRVPSPPCSMEGTQGRQISQRHRWGCSFLSRQQNVTSGEGFRNSSPVLCTGAQMCLEASSTEVGCSSLPACCPMVETAAEIFRGSEK